MELSTKNTKNEILDAYEKLLKEVQQAKSNAPKQIQEEKRNQEIVDKVKDTSTNVISKNINALKQNMAEVLDNLSGQLLSEFSQLEEIRAAIEVEKKNLQELYSLSSNTDSLAAMLLAHKEKKESFEKEQEETLQKWEAEKQQHKNAEKEYNDELQKNRKREEEEFQYNLKKNRQKEQDDYAAKKTALEKELALQKHSFEQETAQREAELKSAEAELTELRKNSLEFPQRLEAALKAKEQETTKILEAKFEFERQLTKKQNELDNSLKDQNIKLLQEKIKELATQLKEYSDKAAKAEDSVKDIAMKAIENSGKIQMVTKGKEGE